MSTIYRAVARQRALSEEVLRFLRRRQQDIPRHQRGRWRLSDVSHYVIDIEKRFYDVCGVPGASTHAMQSDLPPRQVGWMHRFRPSGELFLQTFIMTSYFVYDVALYYVVILSLTLTDLYLTLTLYSTRLVPVWLLTRGARNPAGSEPRRRRKYSAPYTSYPRMVTSSMLTPIK